MQGYTPASYGDGMADTYDEWYRDLDDVDVVVDTLLGQVRAAAGGPVLELGIGTGRLALPLAARGVEVQGVDASAAMVDLLRAKPGGAELAVLVADMSEQLPAGPFGVAFVAYNSLFNLTSQQAQARCFELVAACLRPGGRFVVEAFVPGDEESGDSIEVRDLSVDRVVLSVSRHDTGLQQAMGQFVDISARGVTLRPWHVRYAPPDELDGMAHDAGLQLLARWAGWDRRAFGPGSERHVSVYATR